MTRALERGDVRISSDGTAPGTSVDVWTGDDWVVMRGVMMADMSVRPMVGPSLTLLVRPARADAVATADQVDTAEAKWTPADGGGAGKGYGP